MSTPLELVTSALRDHGYRVERHGDYKDVPLYYSRCPNPGHTDTRSKRLRLFDHGDKVGLNCHGSKADLNHLSDIGLKPRHFFAHWHDDDVSANNRRVLELERDMTAWVVDDAPTWPALDDHALIGLPGDFVRAVEPHTEADPVGLLVQFLVLFGVLVGPGPHLVLDGSRHALNEFAALVGETSKGRKGTAWAHVQNGFLQRSPRGRVATPQAYRHFGYTPPSQSGQPTLF